MVSRILSAAEIKRMVRAEGVEPTRAEAQRIFLPLRLSPSSPKVPGTSGEVWGLDYPFTISRISSGA